MKELLIVETRDAAEHQDTARIAELAAGVSRSGVPATIFLAENGAFAAKRGSGSALDAAVSAGVHLAVDRFALEERGIPEGQLRQGVAVEGADFIVERLAGGATVMWR
jgi:predicted peroxiredoxin